jgi:hypothetical protein
MEAVRMQNRQLAAMEEEDDLDTFVKPKEQKQEVPGPDQGYQPAEQEGAGDWSGSKLQSSWGCAAQNGGG